MRSLDRQCSSEAQLLMKSVPAGVKPCIFCMLCLGRFLAGKFWPNEVFCKHQPDTPPPPWTTQWWANDTPNKRSWLACRKFRLHFHRVVSVRGNTDHQSVCQYWPVFSFWFWGRRKQYSSLYTWFCTLWKSGCPSSPKEYKKHNYFRELTKKSLTVGKMIFDSGE